MRNVRWLVMMLLLVSLELDGCLFLVAGGAGEAGYVAGQDQSAGTTISDQWITTKVKSKLIADGMVKARNINVDTTEGVVTLRGIVFSAREKGRAIALAQETTGVRRVSSHLKFSE